MDDCQILSSVSKITPAYTHITELCQQLFKYNEIAHLMSHRTCGQVHELPKSHIDDNQAMITCVPYINFASATFGRYVWCGCICICRCRREL